MNSPAHAGDLALAGLAARGDRAAFAVLVERASPATCDLLRRMGAQRATAEEVAQDALIAAYRGIASYRGEASFAGWVMRIAARLYLKRRRKEARLVLMAEPLDHLALEGQAGEGPSAAMRLDLDRALAQLSGPERMCVSLCHGAGLTQAEIAESLQVPLGTVKSHVTRGLAKLRGMMCGSSEDGPSQVRLGDVRRAANA